MPGFRIFMWLAPLPILALVAGCATQPSTPESPQAVVAQQPWIGDFGSPVLTALVMEALRNSPALDLALARVDAARAAAGVTSAALYPSVELDLADTRTETGRGDAKATTESASFTAGVAWEVDLWQRVNHRRRAALADTEAAEADYKAARLLLMSEVARGWFGAVAARLKEHLAEKRVNSFRETVETIRRRYRSGIDTALDVRLARENLFTAQATLARRQRLSDVARRALEASLGRYPNAAIRADTDLPILQKPVPDGLKSRLLLRRPDVVAAERRLHAEVERDADARRNFLPGFTLTASGGRSSDQFRDLLNIENLIWRVAASLTQPLFQGGRLSAERFLQDANRRAAVAEYSQTVLTALREVETALAAESLLAEEEDRLVASAEESRQATDLAKSSYAAGLSDILTLLDTQRRAFDSESALLDIRLQRLNNRIDLYLALGGDDHTGPVPDTEKQQ